MKQSHSTGRREGDRREDGGRGREGSREAGQLLGLAVPSVLILHCVSVSFSPCSL